MLTQKEKDFLGLTVDQKIELKKMFNEYLNDYSQVMERKEAVQFAMHKLRQNAFIMLNSY
tara:strand:+ start:730 stop:909 length:180 start_codon:yes stop_codon:yes gene_type:complete